MVGLFVVCGWEDCCCGCIMGVILRNYLFGGVWLFLVGGVRVDDGYYGDELVGRMRRWYLGWL